MPPRHNDVDTVVIEQEVTPGLVVRNLVSVLDQEAMNLSRQEYVDCTVKGKYLGSACRIATTRALLGRALCRNLGQAADWWHIRSSASESLLRDIGPW
jgi:hypothetical protein